MAYFHNLIDDASIRETHHGLMPILQSSTVVIKQNPVFFVHLIVLLGDLLGPGV